MTPDEYLDKKENFLTLVEVEMLAAVLPQLKAATDAMQLMDEDTSEQQREAPLVPLNDGLAQTIGENLFTNQTKMAELALEFYPGTPARMLSPQEWLTELKMARTSFAEWFRRRSPSRWMQDVLKATPKELKFTVETAIATAAWGAAFRQEKFSWDRSIAYKWITRPELSSTGTCSVCNPLNGRVEKRIQDFPLQLPAHPFCKCGIVPTTTAL